MNQQEFYEQSVSQQAQLMMKEWIATQQAQLRMMERIAIALERLAPRPQAPDYQKPLRVYKQFDWASIDAEVIQRDQHGAAIVEWQGQQFSRRSPQNKFGVAIWFSRPAGKDEGGQTTYDRLITFKELPEVDPLPQKTLNTLRG